MKKLLYIFATMLIASSCIYDFTPEGVNSERRLVIEGDIILGSTSTFNVSYTSPIGSVDEEDTTWTEEPYGEAWIECENGKIYRDDRSGYRGSSFTITTESADPSARYRFCFRELNEGKDYVSRWQSSTTSPEIEDIYFDYDESKINLRMDVDGKDYPYFRWDFKETWEFHAQYAPMYSFDEESGAVLENPFMSRDYSLYYCWRSFTPTEFGLGETEKQDNNRMEGQIIESYPRSDLRFQMIYRIDLEVMSLTEDAYNYLHNMLEISDISGSLYSPSPDDTRGNIVCQQDSTEFVIGYVSVVKPAKMRHYVYTGAHYQNALNDHLVEPVLQEGQTLLDYYNQNNRPVEEISGSGGSSVVGWGPRRCVDCEYMGGSKTRPDEWPNNDE